MSMFRFPFSALMFQSSCAETMAGQPAPLTKRRREILSSSTRATTRESSPMFDRWLPSSLLSEILHAAVRLQRMQLRTVRRAGVEGGLTCGWQSPVLLESALVHRTPESSWQVSVLRSVSRPLQAEKRVERAPRLDVECWTLSVGRFLLLLFPRLQAPASLPY